MRGANSPWRGHKPPGLKRWPVHVDGQLVAEVQARTPAEAASVFFNAEEKDGRYPPKARLGEMVFRNHHRAPTED